LARLVAEADQLSAHLQQRIATAEQAVKAAREAEAAHVARRTHIAEAARETGRETAADAAEAERLARLLAEAGQLSENLETRIAEAEEAAKVARAAEEAHLVLASRLAQAERGLDVPLLSGGRARTSTPAAADDRLDEVVPEPDAAQIAEWDRLAEQRLAEYNRKVEAERAAEEASRAALAERAARAEQAELAAAAELAARANPVGATLGERAARAGRNLQKMAGSSAPIAAPKEPVEYRPTQVSSANPVKSRRKARPLRILALIAAITVTTVAVPAVGVSSLRMPGNSMEPTLHGCAGCNSDVVLIDKLGYHFGSISRTDVVEFDRPSTAKTTATKLIARVIGLPGETVRARGGRVYVNGTPLTEPYVNATCRGTADFAPVKVPAGRYFVMSDNRCKSLDSRKFGTIARSSVIGRAYVVVWPSGRWRWI
jgi:signal peptidase I